jgi:hypothetical protein
VRLGHLNVDQELQRDSNDHHVMQTMQAHRVQGNKQQHRRIQQENGLTNRKLTNAELTRLQDRVVRLYGNGLSIREIVFNVDMSYGWVHRTLKTHGVEMRPRGHGGRKQKQAKEDG